MGEMYEVAVALVNRREAGRRVTRQGSPRAFRSTSSSRLTEGTIGRVRHEQYQSQEQQYQQQQQQQDQQYQQQQQQQQSLQSPHGHEINDAFN